MTVRQWHLTSGESVAAGHDHPAQDLAEPGRADPEVAVLEQQPQADHAGQARSFQPHVLDQPDTQCVNSTMFGDVETYLTNTAPQFMQKNFNAGTTPGSLAMAGLSEGGLCSVNLALNNSRQIRSSPDYSGDESPTYQYTSKQQTIQGLFGGSLAAYNARNPRYLLMHQRHPGLVGWFEVGARDSESLQPIPTLHGLASKAGIGTCIATPPGGHDFGLWKQAFSDSLPWLSRRLKLTPQPPSVPAHCVPGTN